MNVFSLDDFIPENTEDDNNTPNHSSDEDFIPEDDPTIEEDEEEYVLFDDVPSTSADRPHAHKKNVNKNVRYLDDGDDTVFEKRIRRLRAEEELERIEKEERGGDGEDRSVQYKDLGNGLRLSRIIWDMLYPFQKTGVKWLIKLHHQRVGGILADEMGLGKTVQTLALFRTLSDSMDNGGDSSKGMGSCLIVCPASIIVQWTKACHQYIPYARTVIFHTSGSYKGKMTQLLKRVVDTRRDGCFFITPYTTFNKYRDEIIGRKWNYLVLDEAHLIKNPDLQLTLSIKEIRTSHRLLLTGTPMQNNLKELWSLVDCVYPGRLGALQPFIDNIAIPITQGGYANASVMMKEGAAKCAQVLRNAIAPYLLRRTKASVEDQLQLPEKNEQVLFCELTQLQRSLYLDFLLSRTCKRMMRGNMLPFSGLAVLRRLCNHPHLVTGGDKEPPSAFSTSLPFGHPSLSGKLEVTRRLLSLWKKQGDSKVLLFSQSRVMLDIVEAMLLGDGHAYLRMDGSTSIASRDGIVTKFNTDPSLFVFLLTTRVGGLGLNLTAANKVLIFDPCWNPSTDTQARERAWRIGQQRKVSIYRLITSGTLEEKIYHRQLFKEFLAQRVLNKKNTNQLQLKTNDLRDLFSLSDLKKGGTETGEILAERTKEKVGKNYFDKYFADEEAREKKVKSRSKKAKKHKSERVEKEERDKEAETTETVVDVEDEDDLLKDLVVLSDEKKEQMRMMAIHLSKNLDLIPCKVSRENRPDDKGELFDGKYEIPYLVKHTKGKREKKKKEDEEEEHKKSEDSVMSMLMKNPNVRSAINHDAVLGFEEKRKVAEKERKARECIRLSDEEKVLSQLRGSLKERGSAVNGESTKKETKKRKREDKNDLLSAIRRRKEEETEAVSSFLGSSRFR